MNNIKNLGVFLLVVTLFIGCTKDEEEAIPEVETPINLLLGTWSETNVTLNGVDSTNQIICDGERELYIFNEDNETFSERDFGDSCEERIEQGVFVYNNSVLTLQFSNDIEQYDVLELTEDTLRFSFQDGTVLIEQTYSKIN